MKVYIRLKFTSALLWSSSRRSNAESLITLWTPVSIGSQPEKKTGENDANGLITGVLFRQRVQYVHREGNCMVVRTTPASLNIYSSSDSFFAPQKPSLPWILLFCEASSRWQKRKSTEIPTPADSPKTMRTESFHGEHTKHKILQMSFGQSIPEWYIYIYKMWIYRAKTGEGSTRQIFSIIRKAGLDNAITCRFTCNSTLFRRHNPMLTSL